MKLLFGLAIAVLAAVILAQRPSTTLEPMNWSTVTILPGQSGFQVATKKDLLIYEDVSSFPSVKRFGKVQNPVMAVRRRNAEGVYVPVGNFTQMFSNSVSTNGKWVALQGMGMVLFSVDSNNNISESTFVPTYGGYVLSDDTFVGWISNDAGNYTISTYQYEASNNTWSTIPGTELSISTQVNFMGEFATYRASDTHLVIMDTTNSSDINVLIYSRQSDKSWKFIESVPVNNSFALSGVDGSVNYNGVDTLVLSTNEDSADYETGFMFVYTKASGQWTEQTFTTSSVGYRPQGNFGGVTTFLDANTLLVTADMEGYNKSTGGTPDNVGKVLMMTRNNNGMWEPTLDFNNPTGAGLWGAAIGVNDYDVIIPYFDLSNGEDALTFYTVPRCFADPINATCNDQQVNDCSQLDVTKVDVSSLYTINNAPCGQLGAINVTVEGLTLVNNKAVQAQFSFSRSFGQSVSCNATVTCSASPVAVVQQPSTQSTPSKVSSAVVLLHACLASLVLGFAILFV